MRTSTILFTVSLVSLACLIRISQAQLADTVYTGGKIYTVNEKQPWAEAIAIKDGKFLKVGSAKDVKPHIGDKTKVVDLDGKMVMPGLVDSHVHPIGVANSWANLRLKNPTDKDAILAEIKAYAEANPDLGMIRGEAWNLGVFENNSPKKELLDAIDSKRPIYLQSQTGHSAWANSKALAMAGITKNTPNGGPFVFDVDKNTGEPSGTVREFAMGAVEQALPPTDSKRYGPALAKVISKFNEYGFTTLKCAEGTQNWIAGAADLDRKGGLNARLHAAWEWRSHYSPHTKEEQDQLPFEWKKYTTERVFPRHVKLFYDGAPDSYTALLLEDYEGRPGFKGQANLPKKDFLRKITEFNAKGLGVLVHVIGDGGGRELVDIFAEVRKRNGDNGVPLHFSHAWMTRQEDIQRLSKIKDAYIDFSPALCYPASEIAGSMMPPIGEGRYQKWFNVRSAMETGMAVGFGSDWASSLIPDPNGFHQMQSWATRRDPAKPGAPTQNVEQRITLKQAVYGFTLGGAQCLGFEWDQKVGSIEAGKLADFIVLNQNIFEEPIESLHLTQVDRTVLGGKVVFDREQAEEKLEIVEVKITNKELDNAVDAAELNLLIQSELYSATCRCSGGKPHVIGPGAPTAPDVVNLAFASLLNQNYRFAKPARQIQWKQEGKYWIQWTLQQPGVAVLWAYDPEAKKAIEVLQVREK